MLGKVVSCLVLIIGWAVGQQTSLENQTTEPPAVTSEPAALSGFNLALSALGGRLDRATSEYDETWAAENLIDGVPFAFRLTPSGTECGPCGWISSDATFPQDFVFSFYQGREAVVSAVVIDTSTFQVREMPENIAKWVEVWVASAETDGDLAKVAIQRLAQHPGEQAITFPPVAARRLMVRVTSNYGGDYTVLGEVEIIEAAEPEASILADFTINLASPALGGVVAWFTSQREDHGVEYLVDGRADAPGWRAADGRLPQDVVFAFDRDQVALIDRIVLTPSSVDDRGSWPKLVEVLVSQDTPLDGFETVGRFDLTRDPRGQAFAIGREARFVKLRVLETFGGAPASLGEVQLLEGARAGYVPALARAPAAEPDAGGAGPGLAPFEGAAEAEPNDHPGEATALVPGQRTVGAINPLGEDDYFSLAVEEDHSVLTLDLAGRPNIRTSLELLDGSGAVLKHFDPGRNPAEQIAFSWAVGEGEYLVRVTEPPVSLVVIWDTSGSMEGATADLESAVTGYLDQVRPSERLSLVRFSGEDVEVLLPGFTSDRGALRAAAEGEFFADGGTPLYDAIAEGVALLEGVPGNRAIVVMTDGVDSTSRLTHPEFWRVLDEQRIRLYTVGLGGDLHAHLPGFASSGARALAHASMATNGRFFFASSSDELRGLYERIAADLRTVSAYALLPTLDRASGRLEVVATGEDLPGSVTAPRQVELIFDASNSMWGQVDGEAKIAIAKNVMTGFIGDLPDDIGVSLRVYGQRVPFGEPGACEDSELVLPFGPADKAKLRDAVLAAQPRGTTPIAHSLRQVAGDFGDAPGAKLVVLVTDGIEECGGSPAEAVAELLAQGLEVRVNVVGFALADEATKREMRRVAELTGGVYLDAQDAEQLSAAMRHSVAVPYDVLDAAEEVVAQGAVGQGALEVPAGVYAVAVHIAGTPVLIDGVGVTSEAPTQVQLLKAGDTIDVRVVAR